MVEKLEGAEGMVSPAGRASVLLVGARQHLEAGHANYIQVSPPLPLSEAVLKLIFSPASLPRLCPPAFV